MRASRMVSVPVRGPIHASARCAALAFAAILVTSCTSQPARPLPSERDGSSTVLVNPGPPEGAILLTMGARVYSDRAATDASPGLVGEALSPDGTMLVATTERTLPTGISYNSDLVLVDVRTRVETVLAHTRPREEFNGPMEWSPDGTRIAYSFVRYRTNPAVVHPGPHPEFETVCIIDLGTATSQCHPDLGTVFDFDWSPDGQSLAMTGPGPQPLQVVDVETGGSTTLRTLDDPRLHRLLGGRTVQFNSPAWSPSGRYVAVWAEVIPGGSIPVIFGANGRIVDRGRGAGLDPRKLMWIPGHDLLLYTPGVTNEHASYLKLYEIDPISGEERRFLRRKVWPQVVDVAISPTGRWLAILRWKSYAGMKIEFVDVLRSDLVPDVRVLEETSLVDWGHAAGG
jgi:dipeptidyl aminopeptidase/acylaminoacyl peptidase